MIRRTKMKKAALLLVIVFAAAALFGCAGSEKKTLYVLNWGDYIDEELLDRFEEETGIEVNYTTMASNEEMLIKLQSKDTIYDICFPSDYIVERLISEDLLHELNRDNIPNLKNIDERFLNLSFDPGNKYSVPYMWGTVGIMYNKTMVKEPVTS
jgi:spermidine/putrescine transport system substrate-binding protein